MKRGNYGLDAPLCIICFLVVGIILSALAIFIGNIFLKVLFFIISFWFIFSGMGMIFSSKIGKYILRDRIISKLGIDGEENILDVGCGRGLMINGIAQKLRAGKAYGIDIWSSKDQSRNSKDELLKNARIEGIENKLEIVNADMRKMPFEDKYFDVIISSLAIHNISDREERKKAIKEIARVTKENGKIAILDLANVDEYGSILKQSGFTIKEITKNQYLMFPPVKVLYAVKD
ncbi:class I SAM-dependent methyltransferase [Clostridium hydrogenum]|uniref:class I SAM-dependent methyltransferase n=1 Tax=Clostridium hydrogenum TaxID=2855764 RepID=UPI001F3CBC24|nr:class I SAM-dependent methyltransferase [Clostridium hydrogenum]